MDTTKCKMSCKRKHVFFTMANKMGITNWLKKGKSGKKIARRYCNGFAQSTAKQQLDKHPVTEHNNRMNIVTRC
jgi:hypothetical protein